MDLIVPSAGAVSCRSIRRVSSSSPRPCCRSSAARSRCAKSLVGRVGLWPVLTFLLLYNHALFWGFLNYLFTAGLAMFAFAGWIALRERPVRDAHGVHAVVALLLYLGHLFGLFVYALLVFGYELWRMRAEPAPAPGHLVGAWAVAGAQFLDPGVPVPDLDSPNMGRRTGH